MSNSLVFFGKRNYQTSQGFFTLLIAFIFAAFAILPYQAYSQEKEESHDYKISEHYNKAMKKATALENGKLTTKAEKRMCVRQIGENLAYAKTNLNELEKSEPANHAKYEEMRKHQAEASVHQKALVVEMAKAKPSQVRVKEHAMQLHAHVEKAELEHKSTEEKGQR